MRRAKARRRPLIYLYGVVRNLYEAVFPCYVVDDAPEELGFHIAPDVADARIGPDVSDRLDLSAGRREYATATVKQRLHQRRFRELVLSAYQIRCAVCRLKHGVLLDAAPPSRAGSARRAPLRAQFVCRARALARDPQTRRDVLEEHDGPMLERGLQKMEGSRILLPRVSTKRPNQEYLEERYGRFRAA